MTVFGVATGAFSCPARAMLNYLSRSSIVLADNDFLFSLEDGSPLSRGYMMKRTAEVIRSLGIDMSAFNGFSWRGGGAVSAKMAGLPIDTIKALGRWSSNAVLVYIPFSLSELELHRKTVGSISHESATNSGSSLFVDGGFDSHGLFVESDFADCNAFSASLPHGVGVLESVS